MLQKPFEIAQKIYSQRSLFAILSFHIWIRKYLCWTRCHLKRLARGTVFQSNLNIWRKILPIKKSSCSSPQKKFRNSLQKMNYSGSRFEQWNEYFRLLLWFRNSLRIIYYQKIELSEKNLSESIHSIALTCKKNLISLRIGT